MVIGLRKLKMHEVSTIILDEADQMFQLSGAGEVTKIVSSALRTRQLVMLSATIGPETRLLANREMKNPAEVGIDPEMMTAASLEHHYVVCEERNKIDMLRRVIRHYKPDRAIVFVNATEDIAEVTAKLNHLGLPAAALYGDADKVTRANVLTRFRDGKLKVLVASDVAARGLDIENLTLVVSFDPAFDSEHYVHRAGRTGRMGKRGLSVTIVTEQQTFIMRKFARELDIQLDERAMAFGKALAEGERSDLGGGGGNARREGAEPRGGIAARTGKPQVRTSAAGTAAGGTGGDAPAGQPGAAAGGSGVTARREQHRPGVSAGTRSAAGPGGKARSQAEREQNRKNKGAPKWLKNKTPRGDGQ